MRRQFYESRGEEVPEDMGETSECRLGRLLRLMVHLFQLSSSFAAHLLPPTLDIPLNAALLISHDHALCFQ